MTTEITKHQYVSIAVWIIALLMWICTTAALMQRRTPQQITKTVTVERTPQECIDALKSDDQVFYTLAQDVDTFGGAVVNQYIKEHSSTRNANAAVCEALR